MDQSAEEEVDEDDGKAHQSCDGQAARDEENNAEYGHDGQAHTENSLVEEDNVEFVVEHLLCVRVCTLKTFVFF